MTRSSIPFPSLTMAGSALVVLVLLTSPPICWAACTGSSPSDVLPKASATIDSWEQARNIRVLPDTRNTLLQEYCEAADQLATEKQITYSDIDLRSPKVIAEYLDRLIDARKVQPSVSALLRTAFGASGFSQAKLKRWGLLSIAYTKKVDVVILGHERIDPVPTVLVGVGRLNASGVQRDKEVCSAELLILAAAENKFDCR